MKTLEQMLRENGRLTGEELKEQFMVDPKQVSALLSFKMENFYKHATPELVEKEIIAQLTGGHPSNLNYGLWIQRYLREGID